MFCRCCKLPNTLAELRRASNLVEENSQGLTSPRRSSSCCLIPSYVLRRFRFTVSVLAVTDVTPILCLKIR